MKKRNFVILLICLYGVILLLTLLLGVMLFREFSVYNQSPQDTATPETLESATTSYYEYMSEHWDEYLAERDRLKATYFDKNIQYLPRDSDFNLIEEGMHISQVVEIVGKPHDMSIPFSHGIWLCWTSVSGTRYSIELDGATPYDPAIESLEKILSNGTVTGISVSYPELDTSEAESLSREQAEALYMDREKTHKPTEQDFDQIKKGMTVQEVVEILGKPHDFHGISNFAYVMVWESVGGEMLTVFIGSGSGPLDIQTVMEGNYSVGEPMRESES